MKIVKNNEKVYADLMISNGKIATLDERGTMAEAVAVKDGKILAVGSDEDIAKYKGPDTQAIDAGKRTVIPGLNDSHLHVIRGGLNYNMELRWDGVPSLADALRMLKEQARRTPPGQWVRVVGGWSEFQFAERRMPTLEEINEVAPDTPVFVLHLYCRAMLNKAALRACGYTKDTPNPPAGEIQHDSDGNPTGLLIARPNATILYATLAKGPKLPVEHQINSTRHFMRELNRLGLTSIIDAGGGYQNYPEDYEVIEELHKRGEMTVRIAYNLFTQRPKEEKEDFAKWIKMTEPGEGDDYYRCNGAGEMLVFSAADFEDFLEPRPDLPADMESELKGVVSLLAANKWPFRLHATYNESISRFLDVYEEVNREIPFEGLHWFFDHCETIDEKNLERVKALGGGIAVQCPHGLPGRIFHGPLREGSGGTYSPRPEDAGNGHSRGSRNRCHPCGQLQSLGVPVLADHREDRGRRAHVPGGRLPFPRGGSAPVHSGQYLVFLGNGQEGSHCPRAACGHGRSKRGLFHRSGGRYQEDRVRADHHGRQDRLRHGSVQGSGPGTHSGAAGVVADCGIRRLRRASAPEKAAARAYPSSRNISIPAIAMNMAACIPLSC